LLKRTTSRLKKRILTMTFSEFGFSEELLSGLEAMNFSKPTPVQEAAIPEILKGRDLIASAQTGTGKTAAFLLPLLEAAIKKPGNKIRSLIIVPTRELGLQIDQQLEGFSYFLPVSSIAVYGGGDGKEFEQQKRALKEGTDIIIATPGKLLSHLNMGYVDMSSLQHLVLDEVDRMLDMGFIDDINRILTFLPEKKQTLFFSATMPPKIRQLALRLLHEPAQVNIALSKPAVGIKQSAYLVHTPDKLNLLLKILAEKNIQSGILFAGRKQAVKEIERALKKAGINVGAIHSDLEQNERESVLLKFRNRQIKLLVATDVVSRGIDVVGIEIVINYDVPGDPEDYVHRIGRTARAETTGEAITFIHSEDIRRFRRIEEMIETEIEKNPLPEGINPGPAYDFRPASGGKSRHLRNRNKNHPSGQANDKSSGEAHPAQHRSHNKRSGSRKKTNNRHGKSPDQGGSQN
jgi:superfamily II DNA/RNA helicase